MKQTEQPTSAATDAYYLGFTANTDPVRAAEKFAQKYGEAPRCSFVSLGNLLVGPIPEREARGHRRN